MQREVITVCVCVCACVRVPVCVCMWVCGCVCMCEFVGTYSVIAAGMCTVVITTSSLQWWHAKFNLWSCANLHTSVCSLVSLTQQPVGCHALGFVLGLISSIVPITRPCMSYRTEPTHHFQSMSLKAQQQLLCPHIA